MLSKKTHPPPNPQWSMLPKDLLEMILARLDLLGHVRFASVCSGWRWAAVENPPTKKPLSLVLSDNPKRLLLRLLTSFWPSWVSAKFLGSLEDWLVVLIDNRELFLLNPALREQIQLPPPPPYDDQYSRYDYKAVLSSPPSLASGSSCTIVLRQCNNKLSYCKLGDKSFTTFYPDVIKFIYDIVFYKEQLYAVYDYEKVRVFNFGVNSAQPKSLPLLPDNNFLNLTVWRDKLIAVGRRQVLELDSAGSRWVEVGSLEGDLMLLVTRIHCQALPARDTYRGNIIYKGSLPSLSSFSLDGKVVYRCSHGSREADELVYFALFDPFGFKQIM